MGKVVVLGGNARSGKSTLSFMLVKCGFSRISLDNIHEIVKNSFDININELSNDKKFKLFENIINLSLDESQNENTNIVIDMYDYLPEDINKLKRNKELEVHFLAYPNCTKEQIKYNVINYSKPTDWIAQVNENYLNSCVDRFNERNKILIKECKKYNMNLIDTMDGENRNIVLKELLERIIKGEK